MSIKPASKAPSNYSRHDVAERTAFADHVPFILRAWWLRDRIENEELNFGEFDVTSGPMGCVHSDPLCDIGNLDAYQ